MLADEAPVPAFRAEARIKAGEALRKAGRFGFALEQLGSRGLAVEPDNLNGLREKGLCLQRLALTKGPSRSLARARSHYQAVLKNHPSDAETWALLGPGSRGRLGSRKWLCPGSMPEQMLEDAANEARPVHRAIDSYESGFKHDPRHYFSGINALTLMHLYGHLTNDDQYDHTVQIMAGALYALPRNR